MKFKFNPRDSAEIWGVDAQTQERFGAWDGERPTAMHVQPIAHSGPDIAVG